MDGSFACPECGSDVEVRGLAPGRQVRCEFCHRLLEVLTCRARPPHLETPSYASSEVGSVGVGRSGLAAGGRPGGRGVQVPEAPVRFDSGPIDQPPARVVARLMKPTGESGEALIDLDAALDLAQKAGPGWIEAHRPSSGRDARISPGVMRSTFSAALSGRPVVSVSSGRLAESDRSGQPRPRPRGARKQPSTKAFRVRSLTRLASELAAARQLLKCRQYVSPR